MMTAPRSYVFNRLSRFAVRGAPGACALALALAGCSSGGSAGIAMPGKPAPSWSEPTSTGGTLSSASLKGEPVYLNFFATWCPPCNQEAPSIETLQRKYRAQGLRVVGVDVEESAAKAQSFRVAHGLSYPAIVDSGTLASRYNVNGLPVHVFIERSGVIKRIVVGQMSAAQIQTAIESIL